MIPEGKRLTEELPAEEQARDLRSITVIGDGTVIGDKSVARVTKQQAGDGAIQTGQARDVDIQR